MRATPACYPSRVRAFVGFAYLDYRPYLLGRAETCASPSVKRERTAETHKKHLVSFVTHATYLPTLVHAQYRLQTLLSTQQIIEVLRVSVSGLNRKWPRPCARHPYTLRARLAVVRFAIIAEVHGAPVATRLAVTTFVIAFGAPSGSFRATVVAKDLIAAVSHDENAARRALWRVTRFAKDDLTALPNVGVAEEVGCNCCCTNPRRCSARGAG